MKPLRTPTDAELEILRPMQESGATKREMQHAINVSPETWARWERESEQYADELNQRREWVARGRDQAHENMAAIDRGEKCFFCDLTPDEQAFIVAEVYSDLAYDENGDPALTAEKLNELGEELVRKGKTNRGKRGAKRCREGKHSHG